LSFFYFTGLSLSAFLRLLSTFERSDFYFESFLDLSSFDFFDLDLDREFDLLDLSSFDFFDLDLDREFDLLSLALTFLPSLWLLFDFIFFNGFLVT